MWIGVLWAGLRVAMSITHVGDKLRHGLLEKSLINGPCSLLKIPLKTAHLEKAR